MKRLIGVGVLVATVASAADRRLLPKDIFLDKVRGGWAGQILGASAEKAGDVQRALDNHELYVEMTFAEVMDRYGIEAATEQFAAALRDSRARLWHGNLAARRNLMRELDAPQTGDPRNNAHANDADFQMQGDFLGLIAPGLPRAVQDLGWRIGHIMSYGDGVYGGIFVGAMYSAAFFEDDIRRVIESGLAAIPPASRYAKVIGDVLAWSRDSTWQAARDKLLDKWGRDDVCPGGALDDVNFDAAYRGGLVALALLYGGPDLERTLGFAPSATAAGILGVMLGFKNLPAGSTGELLKIADQKFSHTPYNLNSIIASTVAHAAATVNRYGGKITAEGFEIPDSKPESLRLEQWEPGRPAESIPVTDARWRWNGEWSRESSAPDGRTYAKSASEAAEATISFEGTGAIVVGAFGEDGGIAQVFVDGRLAIETPTFEAGGFRGSESLWHADNLRPGPHTIRVVVTGRRAPRSKSAGVMLQRLVVLRR